MPALRNKPYFFIKQIHATSKNHSKYLPVCQGGSKRHNNGTHRQQAEIYAETNGTHAVTSRDTCGAVPPLVPDYLSQPSRAQT